MTFSLGWQRRDEEGNRQEIEFSLVRKKAEWKIQDGRFESRRPHQPSEEDWDKLFETMDRHLARGKVTHTDYKIVERIRKGM